MEEPKLFIQTPPFYYIEVETEKDEQEFLEESTSVYEISRRSERIQNRVIARQLHFFSQPINRKRLLQFHLADGEIIRGIIQDIEGTDVKVTFNKQVTIINGNEIEAITLL